MSKMPEKVGKYSVNSIAGRGNVGVVYAGHDPYADRDVAIKVCAAGNDGANGPGRLFRKMFFNEAHTAGSLDHPNILKVFDAGDDDGVPYIVMEYVAGGHTLKDYCITAELLSIERVVEIGFKCAKALDYAHRRGVIHRDIKPTNIMLTEAGDVKIGDFGIAQHAQADTTQVMGIIGSPLYMSPEQASERPVTAQTDLYSVGVVLFELLTGQLPIEAKGFSQLIAKIIAEVPLRVTSIRADVPDALSDVIAKALSKEPSQRFRSGLDLAAALVKVAGQLDTSVQLSDDEKNAIARNLPFFHEFTDSELWEVIRASHWKQCRAGETIITEGSMDQSFYVIVEGSVDVIKGGKRISHLRQGDCFGEMGYLTKIKRTATIAATRDMTVMRINATMMERASVTCQLRFNKLFLTTLIERLARTSADLSRVSA